MDSRGKYVYLHLTGADVLHAFHYLSWRCLWTVIFRESLFWYIKFDNILPLLATVPRGILISSWLLFFLQPPPSLELTEIHKSELPKTNLMDQTYTTTFPCCRLPCPMECASNFLTFYAACVRWICCSPDYAFCQKRSPNFPFFELLRLFPATR